MKMHLRTDVVNATGVLTDRAISEHQQRLEAELREGLVQALTRTLGSRSQAEIAADTTIAYISTTALQHHPMRVERE